jgi:DNA replication initiation complex subunit (GINS family)
MLSYNDLYEILRKEKYSEQLQPLPKSFLEQFSTYMKETRKKFSDISVGDFDDQVLREKKQYENAMTIFKELMLRRKRKILNLVFVAAETGIMKRDFNDMLLFERSLFERLVMSVEDADKSMSESINGKPLETKNRMIIVKEDIEKFVDMQGEVIGPFNKGNLVNIDTKVAEILVDDGKAMFVDSD